LNNFHDFSFKQQMIVGLLVKRYKLTGDRTPGIGRNIYTVFPTSDRTVSIDHDEAATIFFR
jgi:hypothetical protein